MWLKRQIDTKYKGPSELMKEFGIHTTVSGET